MKGIDAHKQGFTLIELLVVITIIGILASVILSSLNTARDKGNGAKISAQVSSIRSSAEIYYTDLGSYSISDNDCASGMFSDAASGFLELMAVGNYPNGTVLTCEAVSTAYAVKATWTDGEGTIKYWCVDNTGVSIMGETTDMLIDTDANCDADDV